MSKNTLFVLIIFQILLIPILVLQKLELLFLVELKNEPLKIYLDLIRLIIPLIYFVLFTIFLVMKKYWFILIMEIISVVIAIYSSLVFHFTMLNYQHSSDLNVYHTLKKLEFWITILLAISFIWTKRKKLSWLSIHGFLLATITCFATIYIASGGENYFLFIALLSLVPTLVFVPYFISEYKKAE